MSLHNVPVHFFWFVRQPPVVELDEFSGDVFMVESGVVSGGSQWSGHGDDLKIGFQFWVFSDKISA